MGQEDLRSRAEGSRRNAGVIQTGLCTAAFEGTSLHRRASQGYVRRERKVEIIVILYLAEDIDMGGRGRAS